jgi:hypothetical protein
VYLKAYPVIETTHTSPPSAIKCASPEPAASLRRSRTRMAGLRSKVAAQSFSESHAAPRPLSGHPTN